MDDTVPSIEVRNLNKSYGSAPAIRNLSFSVKRGEVVGFLGPNGAGKSTTMRVLTGLIPATSGEAWVGGVSVARHPERIKREVGYMPENNPLPEDLRVVEYLRHRARLKGLRGRQLRNRVEEVLEICDLHRKVRRKIIGTLSKGYRQRVGIADAIIAKPAVTIMDEPTIGLDPHQILLIRKLIDNLRGDTTVIISSHILAEVEMSCDRVLILNQGRLVASGTPAELRREFVRSTRYRALLAGGEQEVRELFASVDAGFRIDMTSSPIEEGFMDVLAETTTEDDLSESLLHALTIAESIRVKGFWRVNPSLEDIFLSATRRTWDIQEDVPLADAAVISQPPASDSTVTPATEDSK